MLTHYILSHFVSAVTAVASVLLTLHLLTTRRTPQSVLAWLLALVLLPPIAIPLYLFFGTRKYPGRPTATRSSDELRGAASPSDPIQRVVWSAGLPAANAGNALELLGDGERAYQRLLELIQSARSSVHLTMFILGDDATGWAMVSALVERARAGVEVRVILDAVGSAGTKHRAAKQLSAVGGEVRTFMPLVHAPLRGYSNLRSHRKLAVIDSAAIFTGGMNLAVEYMGPTPLATRWRDIAVVATGPIAADGEALFAGDWTFCGGDASKLRNAAPNALARTGDSTLQLVRSGPDVADDALYDALITAIFSATERVAIVTPYYVPDDPMQRALMLAARRGVRTQLVLPARSNHMLADFARRGLVRDLRAAGVEVYAYTPGMVHAKAMIVDDRFGYVGSPNIDMRSLYLNYENALFVYTAGDVQRLARWIEALRSQCVTDTFDRARREWWLLEQLARLVAPEL